jgi:hypothetical protein
VEFGHGGETVFSRQSKLPEKRSMDRPTRQTLTARFLLGVKPPLLLCYFWRRIISGGLLSECND